MKKKIFIAFLLLLTLASVVVAERFRVKKIHNLFSDDIGQRERILYQNVGSMGGFFSNAEWSPDGTKIVFSFRVYDEPNAIWMVNADGTGFRKISDKGDDYPSWSPDGRRIVFVRHNTALDKVEIWTMNADGTNQTFLTEGINPAWGHTGKIAFIRRGTEGFPDIWLINPDGSGLLRLTNTPESEYSPAWSPDGRKIAFTRYKEGKPNIWVMNADGSGQIQLTTKGGNRASWSPDGWWIAFESIRWRDTGDIWVVQADKTEDVIHLMTKAETAGSPSWSPDGKRILFGAVYKFKVDEGLFIMTLH